MNPRLLIIRPAALGDTLMLMPAIAALRSSMEILFLGRLPGLSFLKPYVDLALDFEGPGWNRLFVEGAGISDLPPIPLPDSAVAFLPDPGGTVKANLKALFPHAAVDVFPGYPPEGAEIHVALYLAGRLEEAGCPLHAHKAVAEGAERPLLGEGRPARKGGMVVLHPGSGGEKKNYPPQFWMEMAVALKENGVRELTILLGPAEESLFPFYTERLSGPGREIISCPCNDEVLSILEAASLYVGHDSGITHLAAMLGTPTIALFKNSSVEQWRPIGPAVRVMEGGMAGQALLAETVAAALTLRHRTKGLYNPGQIQ